MCIRDRLRVARQHAIWVLLGVAVFAGALAMRPWTVLVLSDLAYLAVLGRAVWVNRGFGMKGA